MHGRIPKVTASASESRSFPILDFDPNILAAKPSKKSAIPAITIRISIVGNELIPLSLMRNKPTIPHARLQQVKKLGKLFFRICIIPQNYSKKRDTAFDRVSFLFSKIDFIQR